MKGVLGGGPTKASGVLWNIPDVQLFGGEGRCFRKTGWDWMESGWLVGTRVWRPAASGKGADGKDLVSHSLVLLQDLWVVITPGGRDLSCTEVLGWRILPPVARRVPLGVQCCGGGWGGGGVGTSP